MYKIFFTKNSNKHKKLLKSAGLENKTKEILNKMMNNPYQLPYEKLTVELKDFYSKRINHKHRIVYEVIKNEKIIKILAMWKHYE